MVGNRRLWYQYRHWNDHVGIAVVVNPTGRCNIVSWLDLATARSLNRRVADDCGPGLALFFEIRLQLCRITRKYETKADAAFLADGGMVQFMRLNQPLGITTARHIFEVTLMHEAIMHHSVDDAVK